MKIAVTILLFASCLTIARCNQAADPPRRAGSAPADRLQRESDGTAKAAGVVLENNRGCDLDVACYLQLQVGDIQVRVIYHPGEGDSHLNKDAYKEGSAATKGDHVEVWGRYSKHDVDTIETFSSDAFYIRIIRK